MAKSKRIISAQKTALIDGFAQNCILQKSEIKARRKYPRIRRHGLLKKDANPSEGQQLEHRWTFHANEYTNIRIKKYMSNVR